MRIFLQDFFHTDNFHHADTVQDFIITRDGINKAFGWCCVWTIVYIFRIWKISNYRIKFVKVCFMLVIMPPLKMVDL